MTGPLVGSVRAPRWAGTAVLTTAVALPVGALSVLLVLADPRSGGILAAAFAVGLVGAVAVAMLLYRRPWLAPWGALVIFSTSAELRLRLSDTVGVLKDLYVLLLLALLVAQVIRHRQTLARLRPLAGPLAAIGVLIVLYVIDPAGTHGGSWIFGARLLVEVLALLGVGLLCARPERTVDHLVRAMTVILPFEAVFAWLQQLAGADPLVYEWGYLYGAQVRVTSDGGLRTSGTFEDPFQLAALAVLGLAIALFVASRRQAAVLVVSAIAVLGATSVRTAFIQAGLIVIVLAVRRGWWRPAVALGGVAVIAVIFVLATTTSSVRPGAPEEPLLFTLNGRSSAWSLAVIGPESLVVGNGVGARGIGSTRDSTQLVSSAPTYDPKTEPPAYFAGNPAFLDSAYAQVQSDVGIVGTIAFVAGLLGFAVVLARRCRLHDNATAWAAVAVLVVSMVDWIGRASLASYTTGFLTLYMLGVLVAGSTSEERAL